MVIAIFSWYQLGSADRLHHWIDSKGVTHLSKEPLPQDDKLVEIKGQKQLIESSSRKDHGETHRVHIPQKYASVAKLSVAGKY